jgi:predicted dehydrogenase
MSFGNLSRRGFLARSAAGLAAVGLPVWYAQEMIAFAQENANQPAPAANDRIVMGAIGTGTNRTRRAANARLQGERGFGIMNNAMNNNAVRMIAVADVDRPNAEFAAQAVNTKYQSMDCQIFEDYRRLLENREIEAVTIGVPDHWHAIIAISAMRAGKHVYCEKPLTLTLEEGKAVVRVARETGKTLQTGSQQRSEMNGVFRLAADLVRNNRIGFVHKVTTLVGDNPEGGPFQTAAVPAGLNWDFWQGPTPRVDYVPQRCHYDFRWWYEYSGGKMTDWGAHHNDSAQWALNMDNSGPIAVRATATHAPPRMPNSYNCHRDFEIIYTYGNGRNGGEGTRLYCRANPPQGWNIRSPKSTGRGGNQPQNNGVLFEGENNQWIFVHRGGIFASNPKLISEPLPQNAPRLQVLNNHMNNFLDCVRSRQTPIAHVGAGHRSCSVCHLGNIALKVGQPLQWNPQDERFTGAHAEEANRHLSRPYREGYALPT